MNIFPRRKEPVEPVAASEPEQHPEPAAEVLDEEPRKRTRRGTRGGRGRSRSADGAATNEDGNGEEGEPVEAVAEAPAAAEEEDKPAPAPRRRAPRKTATATAEAEEAPAEEPAEAKEPARSRRSTARTDKPEKPATQAPVAQPAASENGTTTAMLRAIEQQNRQIEQLIRVQEDLSKKLASGVAGHASTRPPRVAVFVDAANIELACDRLRARFDWGKVLKMLTQDRELVRAMAYSPVHDDLNVSMETQRFAEPFLDKGFKILTKPLKRFADGTVKANVDIEIALDVVSMLDRVDVVCLVSGDGDFQPLVEFVQRQGVRCEVVAVGASTANNLRHAADGYIDLQQRLREIRA